MPVCSFKSLIASSRSTWSVFSFLMLMLQPLACHGALETTTGFSGTVPFICSIANGEQDVETSYTNYGSMALLEGFSTPLQLSGNGIARLHLVLTQISGQTAPVFQLFGNIDGFSHLNPKSGNGHSDSYTTLLTQTPKPLTYQLRAFVENAYSGGELQFQAVLTCLDV